MQYSISSALKRLLATGRKVAILGPTCSGKSAAALTVAMAGKAEIISCDSMQVFRGMDIGTAKVTPDERRIVAHHLIDNLDIEEFHSVSRFMGLAGATEVDCRRRGVPALLVGGSGLYAKAFIYGFALSPANPAISACVWKESSTVAGIAALEEEIREHGYPESLVLELHGNRRRLTRAVEVLRITGKLPPSLIGQATVQGAGVPSARSWLQLILCPGPDVLRRSIGERVAQMLANGWMEETERLVHRGLLETPTARQALGYRTIAGYLRQEPGAAASRAELMERLVNETVRFARRQRTWFRHQHPGAVRIEMPTWDSEMARSAITAAIAAFALQTHKKD
jgi:tRNA dimethylallyltransferase